MERTSVTPLTDFLLDQIEARLASRGAKSAAAEYAGISRQNLGRMLRERGVPRESEVLLRLDVFSKNLLEAEETTGIDGARHGAPPEPEERNELAELPTWIL